MSVVPVITLATCLLYPSHVLPDDRLAAGAVGAQTGVEISPDVLGRTVNSRRIGVGIRLVPVGQVLMVPVPPLTILLRRTVPTD